MLPLELVQQIICLTGRVELWREYNNRYLNSKLPGYLKKVLRSEQLKNYVYRNETIYYCIDFHEYSRFKLTFAKNLFVSFYENRQIDKCFNVFVIISNSMFFEKDKFITSTVYNDLHTYVITDMEIQIKKSSRFKSYMYFSKIEDLQKFLIFIELHQVKHKTIRPFLKESESMIVKINGEKIPCLDEIKKITFAQRGKKISNAALTQYEWIKTNFFWQAFHHNECEKCEYYRQTQYFFKSSIYYLWFLKEL